MNNNEKYLNINKTLTRMLGIISAVMYAKISEDNKISVLSSKIYDYYDISDEILLEKDEIFNAVNELQERGLIKFEWDSNGEDGKFTAEIIDNTFECKI